MKKIAIATVVTFTSLYPSNGVSGPGDLSKKVAGCVGSFQAAANYESYVDGLRNARKTSEAALGKFLPLMGVDGPSGYIEFIKAAREQFREELIKSPMDYREIINSKIIDCSLHLAHAKQQPLPANNAANNELAAQNGSQTKVDSPAEIEQKKRDLEKRRYAQAEAEKAKKRVEAEQRQREEHQKRQELARKEALANLTIPKGPESKSNVEKRDETAKPNIPRAENANHKPDEKPSGPKSFTHYSDGSCTESDNRSCVSNEELAKMCSKTTYFTPWLYDLVGGNDGLVSTLKRNKGYSAFVNSKVYVDNGTCKFKFSAVGIINGSERNKTYDCTVSTITDDGKGAVDSLVAKSIIVDSCY